MTYNYLSQADFIMFAFSMVKWLLIILLPLCLVEYVYQYKNRQKVITIHAEGIHALLEFVDNQLKVHGEIDFSKVK